MSGFRSKRGPEVVDMAADEGQTAAKMQKCRGTTRPATEVVADLMASQRGLCQVDRRRRLCSRETGLAALQSPSCWLIPNMHAACVIGSSPIVEGATAVWELIQHS